MGHITDLVMVDDAEYDSDTVENNYDYFFDQ